VFKISTKILLKKVHDSEAFWSEKWAFQTIFFGQRARKLMTEGPKTAHSGWFCAAFSAFFASLFDFFASLRSFLSTPNFQKSTPFENLALTFLREKTPNFCKINVNTS